MRLSPSAVARVSKMRAQDRENLSRLNLPDLINRFILDGVEVSAVDVGSNWAELNAAQDLAQFVLGTKAQTCSRLRPLVRKSTITESYILTVADWRSRQSEKLDEICRIFPQNELAVRSSARAETAGRRQMQAHSALY